MYLLSIYICLYSIDYIVGTIIFKKLFIKKANNMVKKIKFLKLLLLLFSNKHLNL
jgi:hypothetical protein